MEIKYNNPNPIVKIYDPDFKNMLVFEFNPKTSRKTLQGYNFSYSTNDASGTFSVIFYPEEENYFDFFDQIKKFMIVAIHEWSEKEPSFIGVLKAKRFSSVMSNGGMQRRIIISGHCVAGLISDFKLSMDAQAMAISRKSVAWKEVGGRLAKDIVGKNKPVKNIIKIIWDEFVNICTENTRLTSIKILKYIKDWVHEEIFVCDDSKFYYPIGNVFFGENTKNFYDLIEGIVAKPVYEIFPQMIKGKPQIAIRQVQFDKKELWDAAKEIKLIDLKSVELEQTDKEVYTVFFAYLSGLASSRDKMLATQISGATGVDGCSKIEIDDEMYGLYGYRPLYLSLNGYSETKDEDSDSDTETNLKNLNVLLKKWFANLPYHYVGTITCATDLEKPMAQAGETVSLFGGQFYVNGVEHSWNYGGNLTTIYSVSRGGIYKDGQWSELKNFAQRYKTTENSEVKRIVSLNR